MRIVDQNIAYRCGNIWSLSILLLFSTSNWLRWTMGEKVEIFNYSDFLTTKTYLENLILTDKDTRTSVQYNLRYTQEFGDSYLVD